MVDVSIIIPAYNSQKWIKRLLNDIQKQKYEKYEVIIIDDASIDHTRDICEKFVRKDSRFHLYHHQVQRGVSAARNYALSFCKGRYIWFCDSDDKVPSAESLQRMVNVMDGCDLVVAKFRCKKAKFQSSLVGVHTIEDLALDFINNIPSFYYGVIWNKLYRKDIIDKNSLVFREEYPWSEDFFFNMQYYSYCTKINYLESEVYEYLVHPKSICNTVREYIDQQLLNEITKERYGYAKKFSLKYVETEEFEKRWKNQYGMTAYIKLCQAVPKSFLIDDIKDQYQLFQKICLSDDMQEFLKNAIANKKTRCFIYRVILYGIHKDKIEIVYAFFCLKRYIKKYIGGRLPFTISLVKTSEHEF